MSEQDRGAYTPPREQPLAFDARGARDARPMPMTLIASGVVLVVLIGGVIMAYAGGFHGKEDPAKPVGDKVVSLKTAPAPGQVATDPAEKLEVFSNRTAGSTPPAFAAGPEQPAERPKPQLQVQASTLPPVRIATQDEPAIPEAKPLSPAAVTSATARPAAARPATVAKPVTVAAVTTKPAVSATPPDPKPSATALALKPAIAAKPPTTTTATVAKPVSPTLATGGVGAQIGAFSSKELADQGFAAVGKLASTAGHGKRVEPVAHGTATLYRTTVTGFADRDAAKTFCETLTAKGHACIVKG